MSVLVTIAGANTYRFATWPVESTYTYKGKLQNAPDIEARAKDPNAGGSLRQVQLVIDNADGEINVGSINLWGYTVTLAITGISETWVGRVTSFDENGEKVLSIIATEDALQILNLTLPDETLDVGNWNGVTATRTNNTVPMVFGGTTADPIRLPGMVADRTNFRYVFCTGEIQWRGKVYQDNTEITTGFTVYLGTSGQATFPGYVYLEYAADPRDSAGRWPNVVMEVTGLKLGASTEAQCRNPARILQYLLTTARGGACGWGLGVAGASVDSTTFTQAITDCDAAIGGSGFKIDGIFAEQKPAKFWIDEIAASCRGTVDFIAGKWTFSIDKIKASVKSYTTLNSVLRYVGRGDCQGRTNRVRIDYRYRFGTQGGAFLGFQQRDDATSQTLIKENVIRVQRPLIGDHTSAGAIADYLLKKPAYSELGVSLESDEFTGIAAGDVIDYTNSAYGFSTTKFQIKKLTFRNNLAVIDGKAYSDSIFDITALGAIPSDPIIDTTLNGSSVDLPPDAITGLALSTGFEKRQDGTIYSWINGEFTKGRNFLSADLQFSDDGELTWRSFGTTTNSEFHFGPANPGHLYSIRVIAHGANGQASPVSDSITTDGTTGPADVTGFTSTQDTLDLRKVKMAWTAVNASDLSFYEIRKGSSWATASVVATQIHGTQFETFESSNDTYTYLIKAVDTSGNYSANAASTVIVLVIYPSNVTGFTAVQNGEKALLYWNAIADLDLYGYEIREGSTWDLGTVIVDATTDISVEIDVKAERIYNYWIAAKSRRRSYSQAPAGTSIVVSGLIPKNYVVTQDEISAPTGTFSQTEIGSSNLTMADLTLAANDPTYADLYWNQAPGDAILKLAQSSPGVYFSSGTYIVEYDIGSAATCGIDIDSFLFILPTGVSYTLEYRYAVVADTYSAWAPFEANTKTFRYLQVRVTLNTSDTALTPEVTRMTVKIDVPDIDMSGRATIPIGGARVPFGHTYNLIPKVQARAIGSNLVADVSDVTTIDFFCQVFEVKTTAGVVSKTDAGGEENHQTRGY